MAVQTAVRAEQTRGDEEAFLWATAALGEARKNGKGRTRAVLEALVEDLAFDLGARSFPPNRARASRSFGPRRAGEGRRRAAGRV